MSEITRLAILDRGEPAVRIVAAVGSYNRSSGTAPITTVLAHTDARPRPWYAREADEVVMLRPGASSALAVPDPAADAAPFVATEVAATLAAAGCDAVWIGMVPCQDHPALVAACEHAGMTVIGPDSETIARLADPAGLAAVLKKAKVHGVPAAADRATLRAIEVLVLADSAGTVWAMDPRDVSVRRGGEIVLVESPAPGIADAVLDAIRAAARSVAAAAGVRGASVVQFLVDPAGSIWCQGVDTLAQPRYAIVEEATGTSILPLRLVIAAGGHLAGDAPVGEGQILSARLLASDPEAAFAASGGTVEALAQPVGTGVRVDSSLREGDVVDGAVDPVIATFTARGHDRAEAFSRMERAIERTTIVLEVGASNRSGLLALLRQPELRAGGVPLGWYDAQLSAGSLRPAADPVALIAAAIEAYEADLSLVRSAFFASAERGRPEHPEAVGARLALSYRGAEYRLRVDRTSPGTYRIHDGAPIDVAVDRLGEFERRISVGGRRHVVVAIEQGAAFRIEVDGIAHVVTRDDGVVVRTGWPALVAQVLVEPGQTITAGDPVAVLESMKMVSTVTAPFDGVVTSIAVMANAQVERGAPLLRIKAADGTSTAHLGDGAAERVDLTAFANAADAPAGKGADWVFERLINYLLGYDLDPARLKALTGEYQKIAAATPAGDATLLGCEDALLDLFGDIGSLYRPRVEDDAVTAGEETAVVNAQEYFIAFLQWLDADRAGLPERYRARLERALGRYGVTGLRHTAELEEAMVWMFRSFARVPELAPVVAAILQRRLESYDDLAIEAGPVTRQRMERLVFACEGRQQLVADLARDVIFHYFDEPVMESGVADVQREMELHLAALREDPTRADRAERIGRLVWCPHPMRSMLLKAWLDAGDDARGEALRAAILEVYPYRFYRMRDLSNFAVSVVDGVQLASADYPLEDAQVHLVVAYLPLDELESLSRAVAAHLAGIPKDARVVVDLVTWRDGDRPDIATTAADLADRVSRCDFGRPLHRLDFTVTSRAGDDDESHRTQHVTFRQGADGRFVEDVLYRNLHPMLGKRLDLWRLSNFALERLPSPEDVYLFSGVAHDNAKDHRLFALAEVRDLVPVRDARTGAVSYPRLGRIGLLALAAMRSALAAYPPRERPVANRLVLSVRPPWTIPNSQLQALVESYEPLARGAGLEKLVVHVKVPSQGPGGKSRLDDKVIFVEGIGRSGMTVRLGEPGPNPVRPLTRYAQKLLTAKRFGSPYPYEIAQMLTPPYGTASMFPPGRFEELDLDGEDNLVPVDRPPAENTAHLVVGLMTNYTEVVPEGMTRIALMSDPTQGLGNLSEPECRRINAALAYGLKHKIPVEWYAVSSGALIAMDSGTENMDWIALTLRRLIEYTQAGGEVNIIVTGINVGGQPYWNAEATMLMHTKGILIMTPASAMVLTGKQALDFSGAVSADDNFGIGGYDRVMGLNGQGQYWAPSFQDACLMLLQHYDYTYVVPGERFPRRRPTKDPLSRDVRQAPHDRVPGTTFTLVGEVFDHQTNPDRKQPFDMRSVMRSVTDADCLPLERWQHWQDGENSIIWDATVGGIPVCMIGLSSRNLPRKGFVPADGPPAWTSGTLFPQASRKTARAVNATSGNRPLVVLANLSGFDGSPESMRRWQLEYGAEIGRAVTNFDGPIVFVVVSRYHGGAFVVFSKALTESMEIAAVEGSYASVIGGAPAAATVFAREVKQRTEKDARVVEARAAAAAAKGPDAGPLRATAARVTEAVRSEKLGEVADEFDSIHTIERALRVGSVDRIIAAAELRPYVIDALERGMAKFLD